MCKFTCTSQLFENIVANGELLVLSIFSFRHNVFKKLSAAEASKSIYMRERVKRMQHFVDIETALRDPYHMPLQAELFPYSNITKCSHALFKSRVDMRWQYRHTKILIWSIYSTGFMQNGCNYIFFSRCSYNRFAWSPQYVFSDEICDV